MLHVGGGETRTKKYILKQIQPRLKTIDVEGVGI